MNNELNEIKRGIKWIIIEKQILSHKAFQINEIIHSKHFVNIFIFYHSLSTLKQIRLNNSMVYLFEIYFLYVKHKANYDIPPDQIKAL